MRGRNFYIFMLLGILSAGGISAREFPVANSGETPAAYAQRVGLPLEKVVDLAPGVKLELTLIPAGKFMMGSMTPAPPALTPLHGKVALGIAGMLGLLLLGAVSFRKRARWKFPFNSGGLMALLAIGGCAATWHIARGQQREYIDTKELADLAPECERPWHEVLIAKPFYMGRCEITQEQYQAVMGANPSSFQGPKFPVEKVTWKDASAFCDKLNQRADGPKKIQLPTEAQWEYACRAGTNTPFNTGNTLSIEQANIDGSKTMPAGSFKPNAFGLCDMHGNVWEWCGDFYDDNYYKASPASDPPGPEKGQVQDARVLRGGSCNGDPDFYRSSSRRWLSADDTDSDIGFRVALPVEN